MKKLVLLTATITLVIAGCATSENTCEDVTLVSEQAQQCQALQRQITNSKDKPLIRTVLERRYQKDCVDIRYYRDEKHPKICDDKKSTNATLQDTPKKNKS